MNTMQRGKNFDKFMLIYKEFKEDKYGKCVDIDLFAITQFDLNTAKRYVVLAKYRATTQYLQKNPLGHTVVDFWSCFGAFIPIFSNTVKDVISGSAFDGQVTIARDLVTLTQYPNVRVEKDREEGTLPHFDNVKFDTILATYMLEHNLNYKDIIMEHKKVLKSGGELIVLLSCKYFLYRLFAKRKVEQNAEREHVYHSRRGANEAETFISNNFKEVHTANVYTFIYVAFLVIESRCIK